MIDLPTALGLLGEVLTWVGALPALVLLPLGYALGWAGRRHERVDGVVAVRDGEHILVRWFACDGSVQEQWALADAERMPGDDVPVWAHPSRPSRARFEDPKHLGRTCRLLGIIAAATALVGSVLQLIALL